MPKLIERHSKKIVGVVSYFDRIATQGTLPSVCHPNIKLDCFVALECGWLSVRYRYARPSVQISRTVNSRLTLTSDR